jgi:hypothetical protein
MGIVAEINGRSAFIRFRDTSTTAVYAAWIRLRKGFTATSRATNMPFCETNPIYFCAVFDVSFLFTGT